MGIWPFVVLILTQSYTSMLTIRRLEPTYIDVKELIRYGYGVGYQEGSFVLDQLKEMKFDESNLKTYNTLEEFDDLFSKGPSKGGIVFPKGSPLGPDISRKILKLREDGTTKSFQEGAFGSTLKRTCQDIDPLGSSTSLKLNSFRVLFWLTGGFLAFAIVVFFAMFLWDNRQILVDSNTAVSRKFVHLLNEFYKMKSA
ncbi:hypothetical protein MKX01_018692 [Papaver californicum]|nr:hypothetical protein MKX01_018692 [Papaver californicum]